MKIRVCDWTGGRLREALSYRNDMTLDCSLEDALKVAGALYATGLNVALTHERDSDVDAVLGVDDRALRPITP